MSIFVGNLPFRAEREDVMQLFVPFGEVTNCSLPLERGTGRKRGFAFVEMADESLESTAIDSLQGTELMGRPLRINKAEPRNAPPRRNFGYNNPRSSNNPGGYNNSQSTSGGYESSGYNASNYGTGSYGSNNSGGYAEQQPEQFNRTSGAKGWEDRSYGNSSENSEFENGRSRRRRGAANNIEEGTNN